MQGAKGSYEANNVLIAGLPLDQNPQVTAARFRVEQAQVALDRTVVRAPVDGVVVKRSVQVGQMVQPGTPLMTVVPVQQAYVNANFKEVQLKKVRVGQPAELTSDLYGDKVVYHGRVIGLLRRHRRGAVHRSGAECDRQLDQGGAAAARAHCAGPQGACRPSPPGRAFHERRHQRFPLSRQKGSVMTAIAIANPAAAARAAADWQRF